MNGGDQDELDMLAGEYVLGVMSLAERENIVARRRTDPALDAAILRWEAQLAPMTAFIPAAAPPIEVWSRIEREISSLTVTPDFVAALQQRARRWKIAALASGALAASLALGLGIAEFNQVTTPKNFVAILQKDAASPAFVLSVDLGSRELTVRQVDAMAPTGKSYELWLINDQLGAPQSLGVVDRAEFTSNDRLRAFPKDVVKTSLFAITVEEAGGSPSGKPSGPPVFTGKLIQALP